MNSSTPVENGKKKLMLFFILLPDVKKLKSLKSQRTCCQ